MDCVSTDGESLWITLSNEYQKAADSNKPSKVDTIDRKLRTVRIFISSTFRDFHNERNLLVTKVFPRLREWCGKHGLYLVECDLRWGIPDYVSREETLITCMDEIERGRSECNDMNFFLGLVGDRYGWIPAKEEVSENIKRRYNWVDQSSVTLMEFIHGIIRTLTPNGLIMIRSPDFTKLLPEANKSDFIEDDPRAIQNLNMFKEFLINRFSEQGLVHFYKPDFAGITYDKFIERNRVSLKELDMFCETVENYFKECINNNLLRFIQVNPELNNDNFHELMINGCGKQCTIRHKTFLELFNYLKDMQDNMSATVNPIVILSGTAGIGKSTILAYCVKELKKELKREIFFHSVSCTTSSHYKDQIIERVYGFLKMDPKNESIEERCTGLGSIFTNGVEGSEDKVHFVVLDGIDELCEDNNLTWVPSSTHKSVVIVLSTLLDPSEGSFYSLLKKSGRNIKEIMIEPMNEEQLCHVVTNYLDSFGKKLDPYQMKALMSFSCSRNPLWLISACEELRIHGDHSTLTKLIMSLPSNINDLNRSIIKRLIRQDNTNLLKHFLILLTLSRAGLWESVVRELLSAVMKYPENISHSLFLDIVRQLKGFLLIESIPLPLIKFRHRVMKQSIEAELDLGKDVQLSLHSKMASFFKTTMKTFDNLFLRDYVYHLIKSNARNSVIEFMRSVKSWSLFKKSFSRSKIFTTMRCGNHVSKSHFQPTVELRLCNTCANATGHLSLYSVNKDCCFYCGDVAKDSSEHNRISVCLQHSLLPDYVRNCSLCETIISTANSEYVKICQTCRLSCQSGTCGVIVKEQDFFGNQRQDTAMASDLEHLI